MNGWHADGGAGAPDRTREPRPHEPGGGPPRLHGHPAHRRRRVRARLRRPAPEPGPAGGHQDPAPEGGRREHGPGHLRRRGAPAGTPRPSPHRPGARLRRTRRPVHDHNGVLRRGDAAPTGAGGPDGRDGGRHRARRRRRARPGAPPAGDPPRHQAGERPVRRRRHPEGLRFRHRQDRGLHRQPRGHRDRHPRLHGSGAVHRDGTAARNRSVLAGHRPVRAAVRPDAVRRPGPSPPTSPTGTCTNQRRRWEAPARRPRSRQS